MWWGIKPRNFRAAAKVARLADETGAAIILKNNTPRYVLLEYSQFAGEDFDDDLIVGNLVA